MTREQFENNLWVILCNDETQLRINQTKELFRKIVSLVYDTDDPNATNRIVTVRKVRGTMTTVNMEQWP